MAGILIAASTAEIALTLATPKTVLQVLAPTNQRVKLLRWGVYFDGVTAANAPVEVELLRQTSSGTMSALTVVRITPSSETLQSVATHTATSEPTASDVLDMVEVHPQTGYEVIFPFGQEVVLAGADRVGIKVTAPDAVDVRAKMWLEE